jgi:hypothetical protein
MQKPETFTVVSSCVMSKAVEFYLQLFLNLSRPRVYSQDQFHDPGACRTPDWERIGVHVVIWIADSLAAQLSLMRHLASTSDNMLLAALSYRHQVSQLPSHPDDPAGREGGRGLFNSPFVRVVWRRREEPANKAT